MPFFGIIFLLAFQIRVFSELTLRTRVNIRVCFYKRSAKQSLNIITAYHDIFAPTELPDHILPKSIPEELQNGEGFGYIVMFRPMGSTTWTKERVAFVESSKFIYRNDSITPLSPFEVKVGVYNNEGEGSLSTVSIVYSGEDGELSFVLGWHCWRTEVRSALGFLTPSANDVSVFVWMVEPQLAPKGTSVQSFSASEVEVSWNAIAWNRNTGRVLGYEVIHRWFLLPLSAPACVQHP